MRSLKSTHSRRRRRSRCCSVAAAVGIKVHANSLCVQCAVRSVHDVLKGATEGQQHIWAKNDQTLLG